MNENNHQRNHDAKELNFGTAKSEYAAIKASPALRQKVGKALAADSKKKPPKKRGWITKILRTGGTIAASLVLCLIISVNASPSFADTVANLPGMSELVEVMTFGHYEYKEGNIDATVDTPAITGLSDKELEKRLNSEFAAYSNQLITAFEKEVKEWQRDYPSSDAHFGMDSGYLVLSNTEDYFSIDIYQVNTAASSSTIEKFYTINKKTQKMVTLPELFEPGSDYQKILTDYIVQKMKEQMKSGAHTYWLDEPDMMPDKLITSNTLFYIDSNNRLVICFEKYSVAPGCEGTPEFPVPKDIISNILNHNGENDLR